MQRFIKLSIAMLFVSPHANVSADESVLCDTTAFIKVATMSLEEYCEYIRSSGDLALKLDKKLNPKRKLYGMRIMPAIYRCAPAKRKAQPVWL